MGLTLQEEFTRTFDVFPFEQPRHPGSAAGASTFGRSTGTGFSRTAAAAPRTGSVTGSAYGFGSASLRFQNEVYGCQLPYGKVNKAVIELADAEPVDVYSMTPTAPSNQLPEFAANFKPELGRTFAKTVDRNAPPGPNGEAQYWVQPKDLGGLFPGGGPPPAPFPLEAPRGAGAPARMHEAPKELLTPAERREALVFEKCHNRARLALRKATTEACQLTTAMQQRHPHGVIGVEGPGCADSLIYAEKREKRHAEHERKLHSYEQRYDNIAKRRDTQLDYRLMTHDHANKTEDKLFQQKLGSSLGLRGEPSMADPAASYEFRPQEKGIAEFGFRSNQEQSLRPSRPERHDNLVNIGTRGRTFDIISGATLPTQPTIPPRDPVYGHTDRRVHASNVALPHPGHGKGPHCDRGKTAPTLIGPIPDSHQRSWQQPSPITHQHPSEQFFK